MQVVDPYLIFRLAAVERDIGCAAVAAVVDEDAIARGRHFLRERTHVRHLAAPAGRQRDPWTARSEDFVVDVDAVDVDNRHVRSPALSMILFHDSGMLALAATSGFGMLEED